SLLLRSGRPSIIKDAPLRRVRRWFMSLCCRPVPRRLLSRLMLGLLCVLLLLGLAWAGRGDESRPDIPTLIRQLGTDDFDQRELASKRLAEVGEDALDRLKEALKSPDPEVRRRATELVTIIERRLFGELAVLVGHTEGLWTATFSPDGKLAATCSD